ncbi:MAG: isocitrate/isopropylmalate dehydrogenase family protein [Anaerolineae bacterium]|jgi:isocitrate dehydrogenase (NAD+)|nr:isocitrate/isopropylmalate dehydrogenase family protein [Anaerolineae bacterium]
MAHNAYTVTLIPGDGIGPEVTEAACRVLEATGLSFTWDVQNAGAAVAEREGTPLPDAVLDSIRAHGVALKGPVTTPIGSGFRSVNVGIRKALDLYANVRPALTLPGLPRSHPNVDLIVVRENTEGLYTGIEHEVIPDVAAEATRIITRRASERVVRYAFEYARRNGRRGVTVVHKANILKITDGLFLKVAREVAQDYPDIALREMIVDAMCMQLVVQPEAYDVLVTTNLFGDIVSDLCAGLVGGLGVAPGANIGEHIAVFEPVHGSAPDIAGKDIANPIAATLTGALMLRHLGEREAAAQVESAIASVIAAGRVITADLKSGLPGARVVGTRAMADEIIHNLLTN